jgi:hypothetical protein
MTEAQFELMLRAFREQHNELRLWEATGYFLRSVHHPGHQPNHPLVVATGVVASARACAAGLQWCFANKVWASRSCIPRRPCGKGCVERPSVALEYRSGLGGGHSLR